MHLAVVGTGLIGGSFARAARARGLFARFTGIDPDPASARRARELGVVDALADSVPADADAVLLAAPGHRIAPWVVRLAGHSGIVFDTGSVKGAILQEVARRLPAVPARFVPCHPVAGSEENGPDAADAGLFERAEVILTPTADTDPAAVERVTAWWQAVGARVCTMSAAEHDRVLALTSHLPHLVAFAYLQLVEDEHRPHTAGGFRDFTRIGASDARIWSSILRLNREAVLGALDDLEEQLRRARSLIETADDATLQAYLREAARRRGELWERPLAANRPPRERSLDPDSRPEAAPTGDDAPTGDEGEGP
ncbi:MAG TPA: prephenate dehydrogenase/arogenate dehydrogenase family protein [Pseudomonadales bacterium]